MGQSLEEWMEKNGAKGLYMDLEVHAQSGPTEDFARLAMISMRQWAEERYGKKG